MSATACEEPTKMPEGKNATGFLSELNSLPVVQSTTSLLSSAQDQSRVLRTGMAIFEYSFTAVFGKFHVGSTFFSSIDSVAEKGLVSLKEKYPIMTQTPHELQETAYTTVRKTVRTAMKTSLGRVVMGGLDWALHKSTATLKQLVNTKKAPQTDKEGSKVITEHAYASEDSGAFEPDEKTTKSAKEPHSALSALTEKDTFLSKAYKLGIVYPIERLVALLKYLRRYLGGSKRTEKASAAGTSGMAASKRTIKSPRKRLQTSFWGRMKNTAFKLFGARADGRLLGIMFKSAPKETLSPGKAERKRPHDDILTDEGSQSDEDMEDFDLDNYDSEEDPDYEPPEKDSGEESEDSSEGEIESDLDEVLEEGNQTSGARSKKEPKAIQEGTKTTPDISKTTQKSDSSTKTPAEPTKTTDVDMKAKNTTKATSPNQKPNKDVPKTSKDSTGASEKAAPPAKDSTKSTSPDKKAMKDIGKPTKDSKSTPQVAGTSTNEKATEKTDVKPVKDVQKEATKATPSVTKVPEHGTKPSVAEKVDQKSKASTTQNVMFTKDDFKSSGQKTQSPPHATKGQTSKDNNNDSQKGGQASGKHSQKGKGKTPTVALENIPPSAEKPDFAGRVDGFEIIHP